MGWGASCEPDESRDGPRQRRKGEIAKSNFGFSTFHLSWAVPAFAQRSSGGLKWPMAGSASRCSVRENISYICRFWHRQSETCFDGKRKRRIGSPEPGRPVCVFGIGKRKPQRPRKTSLGCPAGYPVRRSARCSENCSAGCPRNCLARKAREAGLARLPLTPLRCYRVLLVLHHELLRALEALT